MLASPMFLRAPTRTSNLRTSLVMTSTTSCTPSLPLLAFSLPSNTTTLTTSMAALSGILTSSQLSISAKLQALPMPTSSSMSCSPPKRLLRLLMPATTTQSRCSGATSKYLVTTLTWTVCSAPNSPTPKSLSVTSSLQVPTCPPATIHLT